MIELTRRAAIKAAAACVAGAIVAGASAPVCQAGNGACTKCRCDCYLKGNKDQVCVCGHHYDLHKRIHPPTIKPEPISVAVASYSVEYVKYSKKNGVVKKIGGGVVGPYPTRQEAQSVADDYNANDKTEKGVRYYYEARVLDKYRN